VIGCENLIVQPIQEGSWFNAVFSFLYDCRFVISSVLAEHLNEILNVYRLCPHPQSGQQQVSPAIIRSYVLSVSDLLERTSAPFASCQTSEPAAVHPQDTFMPTSLARVRHSDRGDIPFDKKGAHPGTTRPSSATQGPEAIAGALACERVLRPLHCVMSCVCV